MTLVRAHMRYYFHLVGPSGAIPDETGLEAVSLEVAEAESLQAIQDIWKEGMFADDEWDGWQLEVTDASQRVLLTIPLDQSQNDHGIERLWRAARHRGSWVHSMLLAAGCGIVWQSPLGML
jgi:hypothetical protein